MDNKFNLFNDIQHPPLQLFNRCVMLMNIHADDGKIKAEEYASNFTAEYQRYMHALLGIMKEKGHDSVRQWATKNLELPPENAAA